MQAGNKLSVEAGDFSLTANWHPILFVDLGHFWLSS